MPTDHAINYTAVLLAAVVGFGALMGMFIASYVLAPRRASRTKGIPYECGIPPTPHRWAQFHIRYYIFAILFLIFDVEAVFLFPWATIFMALRDVPAVFWEMILFIAILFFGIIYGWRKGALQWK